MAGDNAGSHGLRERETQRGCCRPDNPVSEKMGEINTAPPRGGENRMCICGTIDGFSAIRAGTPFVVVALENRKKRFCRAVMA